MKKICLIAFLITSLLSASFAFAATGATTTTGYYSSQHPLPNASAAKANVKNPPTDIVVYNATANTIYVEVPAGHFQDPVYPGGYDHIFNNNGAFYTQLILRGPDMTPINGLYGQVYCPRAAITVYGYTPADIAVDSRRC